MKYNRIFKHCLCCNKLFSIRKSADKYRKNCSKECAIKMRDCHYWLGKKRSPETIMKIKISLTGKYQTENPKHQNSWRSRGKRIFFLKNPNPVCDSCGTDKRIEIHHIDKNYKNNDIKNLQPLCKKCHMKLHKFKKKCYLCDSLSFCKNLCLKHYQRWKKYGNPYMVKPHRYSDMIIVND